MFRTLGQFAEAEFFVREVEIDQETGEDVSPNQAVFADDGTLVENPCTGVGGGAGNAVVPVVVVETLAGVGAGVLVC